MRDRESISLPLRNKNNCGYEFNKTDTDRVSISRPIYWPEKGYSEI